MTGPGRGPGWSARLRACLDGVRVGDAFGETFFEPEDRARARIAARRIAPPTWRWSDDTAQASVVVDVLIRHGSVDPDALAEGLTAEWVRDPSRGYGATVQRLFRCLADGGSWREEAAAVFDGMGSMGNGAAMRAAPIGVAFADDLDRVVEQAAAAARVTHTHPEGVAGAIAVAVAAATIGAGDAEGDGASVLRTVAGATPASAVHDGLLRALDVPADLSGRSAASILGNGSRLLAQDTVPFAIWCAASHRTAYAEALWTAIEALGDRDTICAITGGIVAAGDPVRPIPREWLDATEPLSGVEW